MRLVPSPTSRLTDRRSPDRSGRDLPAVLPRPGGDPGAPGSFTGHGFDACVAPSQTVMDTWNLTVAVLARSASTSPATRATAATTTSPTSARRGSPRTPPTAGGSSRSTSAASRRASRTTPRAGCRRSRCRRPSRRRARRPRRGAPRPIAALKKYGFGSGSTPTSTSSGTPAPRRATTSCWSSPTPGPSTSTTRATSPASTPAARRRSRPSTTARMAGRKGFTLPDHMWIAWTNKVADTDGGPYLSDDGWANHQRIHQYHNGVNVTYGGQDAQHRQGLPRRRQGIGAVEAGAAVRRARCRSRRTRRSSSASTGAEVAALECLLHEQGLIKTVDKTFGSRHGQAPSTPTARSMGWAPSGPHDPRRPGRRCWRTAPTPASSSRARSASPCGGCSAR